MDVAGTLPCRQVLRLKTQLPEEGRFMDTGTSDHKPLEAKAIEAAYEELERQAAENPSVLRVRKDGDRAVIDGSVDLDALVMVIVGSVAGGP
jgi:hypothetical protein